MTLFVYVNTVENGGETEFPVCDLKCQPTEGTAILWSNVRRDEEKGEWIPDPRDTSRMSCSIGKKDRNEYLDHGSFPHLSLRTSFYS